jgi:hypothetical protein
LINTIGSEGQAVSYQAAVCQPGLRRTRLIMNATRETRSISGQVRAKPLGRSSSPSRRPNSSDPGPGASDKGTLAPPNGRRKILRLGKSFSGALGLGEKLDAQASTPHLIHKSSLANGA